MAKNGYKGAKRGIYKENMHDLGNNGHCFAPKCYKMSQNNQPQQTRGLSMLVFPPRWTGGGVHLEVDMGGVSTRGSKPFISEKKVPKNFRSNQFFFPPS